MRRARAGRCAAAARGAALCALVLILAARGGAQDVTITEFLAANGGGLRDEDGDDSDWIELQNHEAAAVNLGGWSLTDDAANPVKWRFPAVDLAPGDYLVVFASAKDRASAGAELHANFKLEAEGEYLALVRPDGRPATAFAPRFPPQRENISYGTAQQVAATTLAGAGAAARFLVPANGGGGRDWTLPGFDDSPWMAGATGLGYDADEAPPPPGPGRNVALGGTATQSTTGFGGDAARAIDGNIDGNYFNNSVTHTAGTEEDPYWRVDLGASYALERVVLWNRTDCCVERLSNFRLSVLDEELAEVAGSNHFTDRSFPATRDYAILLPAGTRGRYVEVARLGPDRTGNLYISLAEVEVFEGAPGFQGLVATDVEGVLRGVNSSLHVRIPFTAADPAAVEVLKLKIKYDDGFVAYLNGEEAARRNAPPSPVFDSAATAERPDRDAVVFEELNITGLRGALRSGENVLAIHGLNLSRDDGDFLVLPELVAVATAGGALRYFPAPTPGAPNAAAGVAGFVADTKFEPDRGFYEAPQAVAITTETPGAVIRYTLDGSAPAAATGNLYTGPIPVTRTTTLRAAAFKDDLLPSDIDTQTYIFPLEVVRQTGAGRPASWGGTAADYAMDPDVVDAPAHRDTIADDIVTRIPTLSLVLDNADLFGPAGIYSNTEGRGRAWEKPCSMEIIYPEAEGREGHQVNCGLRIFGFGWRSHSASLKHAFRLVFRRDYGPAKLDMRFFPDWPVERFDDIVLRSQGSRSWNDFRVSIEQTCYIRDAWARYTERDMGKLTTSSTYVNLYLNGLYWGLYNPVERPDAEFMAEHLGGAEEDYDALNARTGSIEVIDGSRARWDALIALARGDVSSLEAYGRVKELLDVPDFIDYMLLNFYTVNQDWVGSNGNNMRVAGAPAAGAGFKCFSWDMEYSIWNAGDNVMAVRTDFDTPALLYARLAANPEFRLEFADRAHRHLGEGGALSPARAAARWEARAEEIRGAVAGESARWGDRRREPPYTRDVEWTRERNRLLGSFFPQRTGIMLGQLRQAGMFPALAPPAFNQPGGLVAPGFAFVLSAPAGTVYHTTDGTDPRLPGGGLSPAAREAGSSGVTLLASGAAVRVHVPADASLGLAWTAPDFDASGWRAGTTGVGFETATGFEDEIGTDVLDLAHGVNATTYMRLEFEVADPAAVSLLTLRMKYDDGFAAYLNGEPAAAANAPAALAWNAEATASHADNRAVVFEDFDISASRAALRAGRNVLAIHGLNFGASSGDMLFLPEVVAAEVAGGGVRLERPALVRARANRGGEWSALAEAYFYFDLPLRVTEIMYHPRAEEGASAFDADDFEFLELANTGGSPLDLDGWRIRGGVDFDFTGASLRLAPGETVLVVKSLRAFNERYPFLGALVAGEYAGSLSNWKERVLLEGPAGEPILDFEYSDLWHPETDGAGHSLVVADPRAARESWGERAGWRPSDAVDGSPGAVEGEPPPAGGRQRPGNVNGDARLDISDPVDLLGRLFLGGGGALPCAGASIAAGGNRVLADANGDGGVNLTDAVALLNYLFLSGPPPALGTGCVRIEGCPEACQP